jgi:glycosyltransferase involved in cell wall biosynthesis
MRILLSIHHALDPDLGAPGATIALGKAYADLGHAVSYLSFDDFPDGLPPLAKELLFPEFAALELFRRRREPLDVIDASTGDAWLWGRLRRVRDTRPLLVTRSHGLEHRFWDEAVDEAVLTGASLGLRTRLYHGGLRLREVADSLRRSDLSIFTNRDDLEYAVDRLGVARARSAVSHNGLPAPLLGLPLPRPPANGLRVAHIGTYAERKGARYAAAALADLLAKHRDVRVSFVGARVPPEQILAALPESVRERVVVVPSYRHEELPTLLEGHHVLLSASLAEGFSLALPEGMACGLAPVATGISGAREIVRDGENGLLVPRRDAAALAVAIERLLDDRELLARLRTAAHSTAQDFSWRRIAEHNLDLYERASASWANGRLS